MSGFKPLDTRLAFAVPPFAVAGEVACNEGNAWVFYPGPGRTTADAAQVCGRCRKRVECLEWALDTRQEHGVWGGVSADDRRAMLRRRGAARPENRGRRPSPATPR